MTSATSTGSFELIINTTLSSEPFYVFAEAPGEAQSDPTYLTAAIETGQILIVKYHIGNYGRWYTLANVMDHDIDLTKWKMNDYVTYSPTI